MKKYIAAGFFSVLTFGAYAGEAIIPYWHMYSTETPCISISNVSNKAVNFKVTLYNQDSSKYTGDLQFAKNIAMLDQDTLLPARGTAKFCLQKTASEFFGHGVIKTSEIDEAGGKSFVIAHSRQVHVAGGYHSSAVPINGGLPF